MNKKTNITIGLHSSTIEKMNSYLSYTLQPRQIWIENLILNEVENKKPKLKYNISIIDADYELQIYKAYDYMFYGSSKEFIKILDENQKIIIRAMPTLNELKINSQVLISEESPFVYRRKI
jgi:uncharacterized Zn-finger protein